MKTIRVVAALIPAEGAPSRFLVQQRLPGKARANLWEFPGGKVEPGETDEVALARECREELDVELQVGRRLWGTTHAYEDLTVTLELFAARILSGEPKALGAQALRFCTFDEMRAMPFCEADVPLLEALARGEIAPI
jgi:8-oxo-dGTP diphosphatase